VQAAEASVASVTEAIASHHVVMRDIGFPLQLAFLARDGTNLKGSLTQS
jgi:hypothetical protein